MEMAKSTTSTKASKATKIRKYPKRGTIGRHVLDSLKKNPEVTCKELLKVIKKKFPDSRFNPAHLSWYKNQLKNGRYVFPK